MHEACPNVCPNVDIYSLVIVQYRIERKEEEGEERETEEGNGREGREDERERERLESLPFSRRRPVNPGVGGR